MNCITDFVTEYHSKYGLIENVNIISLTDDDCALEICSNKSIIKTSISRLKILIKPHEKVSDVDKIDTKQNIVLTTENYSCIVRAIKIHSDKTVEVMPISDLLLNNETTKQVSLEEIRICGEYENFEALKSVSLSMPREYCRYFNNIALFKPLLSRTQNVILCWNAEELKLKVLALDENALKKIEFLMPVFVSQLGLLVSASGRNQWKTVELLSSYIVWEYQYENEEEANYAIGYKGSHIVAVRNFKGIAGVVLTKTNRLRIIAENISALREARGLLEIKRESFMFDDSFIPILIGKSANHINELVSKAGLHCIYVPNSPWNGTINDCITINDPSMHGKRELFLYGTRDSITSAKLLLEMEESVKDLKREFELRKNSKLRQSFSLKSSTSSISRESDKAVAVSLGDEKSAVISGGCGSGVVGSGTVAMGNQEEVFDEEQLPINIVDGLDHHNQGDNDDKGGELTVSHSLLWADQHDESDDDNDYDDPENNVVDNENEGDDDDENDDNNVINDNEALGVAPINRAANENVITRNNRTNKATGGGWSSMATAKKEDYTDFYSSQMNARNRRGPGGNNKRPPMTTSSAVAHNNSSTIGQSWSRSPEGDTAILATGTTSMTSYNHHQHQHHHQHHQNHHLNRGGGNHWKQQHQSKMFSSQPGSTTLTTTSTSLSSSGGGGMLFTNSSLASSDVVFDDAKDEFYHHHHSHQQHHQYGGGSQSKQQQQFGVMNRNNSRNHHQQQYHHHHNNNNNNSNNSNNSTNIHSTNTGNNGGTGGGGGANKQNNNWNTNQNNNSNNHHYYHHHQQQHHNFRHQQKSTNDRRSYPANDTGTGGNGCGNSASVASSGGGGYVNASMMQSSSANQ